MKVVVLGAGIGGLAVASRLRGQGYDVVLLEKNKDVGDYSIAAAYSFYPGKNLGGWGDGGGVTTNSKKLMEKITAMRVYGSENKYYNKYIGFNSRLQPFQGIVLSKKLEKLNKWNVERNKIASLYSEAFADNAKIVIPKIFDENYHVWHLYVLRVKNRNKSKIRL